MDNMVRNQPRKPAGAPQGAGRPVTQQSNGATNGKKKRLSKQLLIGFLIGLAIAAIAAAAWLLLANRGQTVATDRYQAVFLDDGKVFFGRIQSLQGEYLTLEDAYYTQQQQAESATPDGAATLQASGQVNIVKVGEEIYGPENSMAIRSDQVLFWQNLTDDNQIVKAIEAQSK